MQLPFWQGLTVFDNSADSLDCQSGRHREPRTECHFGSRSLVLGGRHLEVSGESGHAVTILTRKGHIMRDYIFKMKVLDVFTGQIFREEFDIPKTDATGADHTAVVKGVAFLRLLESKGYGKQSFLLLENSLRAKVKKSKPVKCPTGPKVFE